MTHRYTLMGAQIELITCFVCFLFLPETNFYITIVRIIMPAYWITSLKGVVCYALNCTVLWPTMVHISKLKVKIKLVDCSSQNFACCTWRCKNYSIKPVPSALNMTHRWTDGQTDGQMSRQTDRRMDGQKITSLSDCSNPLSMLCGGINYFTQGINTMFSPS